MLLTSPASADTGPNATGVAVQAERMESMLWLNVLQAMSANGETSATLGTGAGTYNDMFMWNIAKSDFGSTDSTLTKSLIAQMTGANSAGGHNIAAAQSASSISALLGRSGDTSVLANAISASAGIAATSGAGPSAPQAGQPLSVSSAVAYAKQIWPAVQAAAQALQVPASGVLAQTALESGWGQQTPGNNLFGVKAAAGQAATTQATHEFVNGVEQTTQAAFAAYGSVASAAEHYVGLIEKNFSGAVGATSVGAFASALQSGGYATDPQYADKIVAMANSPMMSTVLQTLTGVTP
jgi:flagellar protein FlgJ